MKKLIAIVFASLLAMVGLVTVAGENGANAATGYPAPFTASCNIVIKGAKGAATFAVTSTANPAGGLVQIKLHKVHTPGTAKIKITRSSYTTAIPKKLSKGTWHGTMIYLPAAGSQVAYCGVVFYDLHVK